MTVNHKWLGTDMSLYHIIEQARKYKLKTPELDKVFDVLETQDDDDAVGNVDVDASKLLAELEVVNRAGRNLIANAAALTLKGID